MSTAPAAISNDRLVYMLFLATLFHGVLIMGITFRDEIADFSTGPLEVVLVGMGPAAEAPERARYIAERAQRGDGGGADGEATAGALSPADPVDRDGTLEGQALEQSDSGLNTPRDDSIVTPGPSELQAEAVVEPPQPEQTPLEARLMHAAPASNAASLDGATPASGGGRERIVSVDTQEALYAGYLAAWKMRVEQLGTLNFPDAARRAGLAGNPVLEVAIGSDGALREIIVVRSSQQKLLDQAALRILRLAAPFEPFPEELKREYDVLRFVYEWRFIGQQTIAQR
jgi:protein TonB